MGSKKISATITCPTEAQEGRALMQWVGIIKKKHPMVGLLYHIPNGGARDAIAGAKLKAEGQRAGMPDYCLPVPRLGKLGSAGALYIELKRLKGSAVTQKQFDMLRELNAVGNRADVCHGWEEAAQLICWYLDIPAMDWPRQGGWLNGEER